MILWNSFHLAPLHDKIVAAGLPLLSVRLKAGSIELVFTEEATDEQKAAAQKIVDEYDSDAEGGTQADTSPITDEEIDSAKTVADVKALLKKMRKG